MPSAKGKDKSSKPDYIQRCVGDLIAQGKSKEAAFAICTSTMQKAGYLTKGAGMKQTAKGEKRAAEFAKMPDNKKKLAAYEKAIKESALGALASALSNMIGMTEDTASGSKIKRSDWELDDSLDGVEDAQNALTLAAQRAQKIVQAEVAKAKDASEEEVLAIIRRVKREVALPVHKKFREYGSMDTEAMDTLDRALANAAKSASSGLDLKSIYLSI
jgi:hypothetical protein